MGKTKCQKMNVNFLTTKLGWNHLTKFVSRAQNPLGASILYNDSQHNIPPTMNLLGPMMWESSQGNGGGVCMWFSHITRASKGNLKPQPCIDLLVQASQLFSTPKIVPPSRIKVALIEIKTCGLLHDHKILTSNGDFFEAYQTFCVMDLFLLIIFFKNSILFYFMLPFGVTRHLNK